MAVVVDVPHEPVERHPRQGAPEGDLGGPAPVSPEQHEHGRQGQQGRDADRRRDLQGREVRPKRLALVHPGKAPGTHPENGVMTEGAQRGGEGLAPVAGVRDHVGDLGFARSDVKTPDGERGEDAEGDGESDHRHHHAPPALHPGGPSQHHGEQEADEGPRDRREAEQPQPDLSPDAKPRAKAGLAARRDPRGEDAEAAEQRRALEAGLDPRVEVGRGELLSVMPDQARVRARVEEDQGDRPERDRHESRRDDHPEDQTPPWRLAGEVGGDHGQHRQLGHQQHGLPAAAEALDPGRGRQAREQEIDGEWHLPPPKCTEQVPAQQPLDQPEQRRHPDQDVGPGRVLVEAADRGEKPERQDGDRGEVAGERRAPAHF